jgi:hypothetical protein
MQRSNDETASERTPGAADEAPQECVGGCGFFGRVRTYQQPRAITLAPGFWPSEGGRSLRRTRVLLPRKHERRTKPVLLERTGGRGASMLN